MSLKEKLFKALGKTRSGIADTLVAMSGQKVTTESLEDLEEQLLAADLGWETVESILAVVERHRKKDFIPAVKNQLLEILGNAGENRENFKNNLQPVVTMVMGVNGTGKTTSAAKLAQYYHIQGETVLLIAADTYRAAAVQQLHIWSERVGCRLVYNEKSQQPSAVLFDGLSAARTDQTRRVIVDTAGRLHTTKNLMQELEKMVRVVTQRFDDFTLESLITIDASLGQNSLIQAREFHQHVPLNGAILTKMDGSAKGGIVFPLYRDLHLPVRFIGVGEQLGDLAEFDPELYVKGLLGIDDL